MPKIKGKCKNCLCWTPHSGGKAGFCHARAPVPSVVEKGHDDLELCVPSREPNDGCVHDYVPQEEPESSGD